MSVDSGVDNEPRRYGIFGGRYVPEVLWSPLEQTARAYRQALDDEDYGRRQRRWRRSRLGRPTPLTRLDALSNEAGGAQIWAKREDLCQEGTFCITSAITQALVACRMGKTRLIGETTTGDFGVALASVGAALGLDVTIYMGRASMEQEPLNVTRMQNMGVELISVDGASRGRSHAMAEALRNYSVVTDEAMYATSSLASPDPYPAMVAQALSVIGTECRDQLQAEGVDVEYVVAPVGSGSFAAGLFSAFIGAGSQLVGVQAGGEEGSERDAASLVRGRPGVYLGTRSLVLQDEEGQIEAPHADAWGLAMPVVGPQHARWLQEGHVHYVRVNDADAIEARRRLVRREGIFSSRETGYGLAYALKLAPTLRNDQHIVVGISGSGLHDLGGEVDSEDEEGES